MIGVVSALVVSVCAAAVALFQPSPAGAQTCVPDTVTRMTATIISPSQVRLAIFNMTGDPQGPFSLRVWAESVSLPGVPVFEQYIPVFQLLPHSYNYFYVSAEPFTPLGTMNGYAQWQDWPGCPVYEMLRFYRGWLPWAGISPTPEGDGSQRGGQGDSADLIVIDELGPGY